MFGTFEARLRVGDLKGEPAKARADGKATLVGAPALDAAAYMLLGCGCVAVWARAAVAAAAAAGGGEPLDSTTALYLALLAGCGPVLLAGAFALRSKGPLGVARAFLGEGSGPAGSRFAPLAGVLHLLLGLAFCAYPVFAACYMTLLRAPPQ